MHAMLLTAEPPRVVPWGVVLGTFAGVGAGLGRRVQVLLQARLG